MRADAIWPRTWLLATVAGWAVIVAVLSLFGLGGHIAPLPDDPASAPRLPALPRPAAERLGPLGQYSQLTARPPFYESRQPQPFYISGEAQNQAPSFDYVLTSVLMTPAFEMAILQPSQGGEGIRIRVGEASSAAPQWTLVEVAPRSAVFEGPEGRRTLELRVFNGTGGQAPTSTGAPPVAPPGANPAPMTAAPPTGGNAPAMPAPVPPAGTPTTGMTQEAGESPAMTTEQQMDAIRKRIEARRAQMRQQQQQPQGQPVPPAPTP